MDGCSSLKEIDVSIFNTGKVIDMSYMFFRCPEELIIKIKKQNKNIRDEALIQLKDF